VDPQSFRNLRNLMRWLRDHRRTWRYAHVSAIAVRLDGAWVALWTRVVLAQSPHVNSPLGKPLVRTDGVLAFRVSVPLSELRQLMWDVWTGEVPAGRLKKVPFSIKTWCPPGKRAGHLSFDRRTSATWSSYQRTEPNLWPRAEAEWRGGSIADWAGNDVRRYDYLAKTEQLFKTERLGTIAELGTKLDFEHHSSDFVHSPTIHRLTAPVLARLRSVDHDRDRNVVVVTVEVGRHVPRSKLRIGLVQPNGPPPNPAVRLPRSSESVATVEIPVPAEGRAEVSLTYEGLGEISSMSVEILPRLRPWTRLRAISLIDPGLAQLRSDVAAKTADLHERGVSVLLELLGFASVWWSPKLRQPAGSASGQHAQDIVAFSQSDDVCLVVECKTDWTKDSKINTLVGRSQAMAAHLKDGAESRPTWVRALLAVSRPRLETPPAILENLKVNRAGLLTLDDANELLDMMASGLTEKEVAARFEKLFETGELGVSEIKY
jgi:hypothetical protein